ARSHRHAVRDQRARARPRLRRHGRALRVRAHESQRTPAVPHVARLPAGGVGDHDVRPRMIEWLPTLNASLNALAGVLLIAGYTLIRRRRIAAHRRAMIAAFTTSALFLISYVVYHANAGSRPYHGTGFMRVLYFSILVPHVILAAAVLPMAIVTLRRGLRRDDARHRRLARVTFPIWMFVSVTGVAIYVLLYLL